MKTYNYNFNTGNGINEFGEEFSLIGRFSLIKGNEVIIFDTKEEKENYINTLTNTQWNKEIYSEELNKAHKELYKKYYYDSLPPEERYESIGEIVTWLEDEDYGLEATNLLNWWRTTCKQVIDYLSTVTEETALPINQFIESLGTPI